VIEPIEVFAEPEVIEPIKKEFPNKSQLVGFFDQFTCLTSIDSSPVTLKIAQFNEISPFKQIS
jgi:hypothetical protein